MSLSPEEQYHQNIFDEKQSEEVYIPKANASSMPKLPSVITNYKILLKQNSQLNKKIINYFKENLRVLNKSGFVFEWIAVYDEEIEFYEEQGIEKFPTLVMDKDSVAGVSNITKILDQIVNSSQCAKSTSGGNQETHSKKETEEEMHDFLLRELKSKDDENDPDDQDNVSSSISQRVASMNQSRKENGLHSTGSGETSKKNNNVESGNESGNESDGDIFIKPKPKPKAAHTLTTSELIMKTSNGNKEDAMMSKFWENQEETEM